MNPHIQRWIDMVESGEVPACREMKLLVKKVKTAFRREKLVVDDALLEKYLGYQKYFPFERLFEWQEFCIALHLCTFRQDGSIRWPNLFIMAGRGVGKDGFIAYEAFCMVGPHNKMRLYDVDICANAEEQAMRPLNDLISVLETAGNEKLRGFFKHTKQMVKGRENGGEVRGRTNSPKSRDGMRSGMIVFNEIHQYTDKRNIEVFKSGLGKGERVPRQLWVTTNGYVRDGPLDEMLGQMTEILNGERDDDGFLPFICKLDKPEEAHKETLWAKANPSLPYMPVLMGAIRAQYKQWKDSPNTNLDLMTKRFNLPEGNPEVNVATRENIQRACRAFPDLEGRECVAGIDFASIRDFAVAGLLFNVNDTRYWVSHSWANLRSPDLERMKYPWKKAVADGLLTVIDDAEIPMHLITDWLVQQTAHYNIKAVALDRFRYAVARRALEEIGFSEARGASRPIKYVPPSGIGAIVPLVDSWFVTGRIAWGEDNHIMRWYTNNTALYQSPADKKRGAFTYAKIEPRLRKNDGFMALAAAATLDAELTPYETPHWSVLGGVITIDNG